MTKLCELILGSTQFRLHSINVDNYTALLSIALISLSSNNTEDKTPRGHSRIIRQKKIEAPYLYCLLRHENLLSYFGIFTLEIPHKLISPNFSTDQKNVQSILPVVVERKTATQIQFLKLKVCPKNA